MRLGATALGSDRCAFLVWAPGARSVEVHLQSPQERWIELKLDARGYHEGTLEAVPVGSLYRYRLDGRLTRPDPASRFQPQGVHGPSCVVDPRFDWEDTDWSGLPLEAYVIYEVHVGAFTPEGTFEAIIPHLEELAELGIRALELMPVAQFPGKRNWGYDGVYPFAVQGSYGGPEALKRLVSACHRLGIAVVLDVVYNHLGPEGNYLADFGPYFTDCYKTPWGMALNFDGPQSDEVRRFFIENALYWVEEFHIDALRLDALHAILDRSAYPFLAELADALQAKARALGRSVHLIGESDLNDTRLIRPRSGGGCGLDAQWNDDFHHALHALLSAERTGYYQDFGSVEQMAKALREGFVYSGQYSAFRKRRHGNASADLSSSKFVVFSQNHDQVGNRLHGERLSRLVPFEGLKLAAGIVLLSPFIPLLFMGEEYGETAPFLYFVDHSDPKLIEAVRSGRAEEFAAFAWKGELPDPQDEATFRRSRLARPSASDRKGSALRALYQELMRLRRSLPAFASIGQQAREAGAHAEHPVVWVRHGREAESVIVVGHFGSERCRLELPIPAGSWNTLLDSAKERWEGPGSSVPSTFRSEGRVNLEFSPYACVVCARC